MSIFEGLVANETDLEAGAAMAARALEQYFAAVKPTPRQLQIMELLREGLSLADIMELTKEHRDAMLAQGIRLLQLGEPAKARELMTLLYQLEPMDERTIYVLAGTYQVEGDYVRAGKLMVQFLALDATSPDGYLRLGECLLANDEVSEAVEAFEMTLALVARTGAGTGAGAAAGRGAKQAAHARKMLDLIGARADAGSRDAGARDTGSRDMGGTSSVLRTTGQLGSGRIGSGR